MTTTATDEDDVAMNEPQQGVTEGEGRGGGGGTLEQFSIVVIGGGQTGLAAGYALAQRGIDFVILERSRRLGENWRPRWDSLRLFTPARYDGLPGFPFEGDEGRHLTKDQMADYLEEYARRFGVPVRLGINVLGLTLNERGQVLVEWEHGRLVADQVIVATDVHASQRRTTYDHDLRTIQLRAGDYRTLSQLSQAGAVVVLGAASSGSKSR